MNQDIVRFDVTVHDLIVVRMFQCGSYLQGIFDCNGGRQPALPLDTFLQGLPWYVFHHDVMSIGFTANIINAYDVRMRKPGGRACFLAKLGDKILVAGKLRPQQFYGNLARQQHVFGQKHFRHAAAADSFQQTITVVKQTVRVH